MVVQEKLVWCEISYEIFHWKNQALSHTVSYTTLCVKKIVVVNISSVLRTYVAYVVVLFIVNRSVACVSGQRAGSS